MGPPDPPSGVPCVSSSAGAATISWNSPAYDGGCTVTGYSVEMRRACENTWTTIAESCHSLSHTVSASSVDSFVPGETYRFRVKAENVHGLSDPSTESDPITISLQEETTLSETEDIFESPFEARMVEPEEMEVFKEKYDVHEELGKGRYGVVRRVADKSTSTNFAAKFVRTIKAKDRQQVREEIKIMNILRHPKLLLLAAAFESPRETVMVTEYISGGELFERVVADDFTLTERDSILFMRQICEGVEYMHKNNVVHLDLKPENIMCHTRTSHQIKLIDFGLAQALKPGTPIRVLFGTPEFIPPEIINYEPIGTESDMWSVGVICYVLLTGLSPFMGENDAETFANITLADYDLEDEAFEAISENAKDFISRLLIKRKESRMSAIQCLDHPWMAQQAEKMSRIALPTEKLKKFIVRRKWQKTGNAIRALGRMAFLSANSRRNSSIDKSEQSNLIKEESITKEKSEDNCNEEDKYIEKENIKEKKVSFNNEENESSEKVENLSLNDDSLDINECSLETKEDKFEINELDSKCDKTNADINVDKKQAINEKINEIDIEKNDIDFRKPEHPNTRYEAALDIMPIFKDISLSKIPDKSKTEISEVTLKICEEKLRRKNMKIRERNADSEEIITNLKSEMSSADFSEDGTSKTHVPRRALRGDSRDSGIDDCSSNATTSCLQVDETGMVSVIKEEIDNKISLVKSRIEDILKKEESSDIRQTKDSVLIPKEKGSIDLTKQNEILTSPKTNTKHEVAAQNKDTRIVSGRVYNKFVPTGNVSRTTKMFEMEKTNSTSANSSQNPQRIHSATGMAAEKQYNERIQRAFAFWNK